MKSLVLGVLGLLSSLTFAQEGLIIHNMSCRQDLNDPFDPATEFNAGPNKDKCVDNTVNRSIKILSAAEAARYHLDPSKLNFANFYHVDSSGHGEFYFASLDPNSVQDVKWLTENFPPNDSPVKTKTQQEIKNELSKFAGHTMLRFVLKPGHDLLIQEQNKPWNQAKRYGLRELVFSGEASGPTQFEKYDAFKALDNVFAMADRIVSINERYDWIVKQADHRNSCIEIKFSDQQKQNLLTNTLQESDHIGAHTMYNTWNMSCDTEPFALLDKTAPHSGLQRDYINAVRPTLDQKYPIQLEARLGLLTRSLGGKSCDDLNVDPQVQEDRTHIISEPINNGNISYDSNPQIQHPVGAEAK